MWKDLTRLTSPKKENITFAGTNITSLHLFVMIINSNVLIFLRKNSFTYKHFHLHNFLFNALAYWTNFAIIMFLIESLLSFLLLGNGQDSIHFLSIWKKNIFFHPFTKFKKIVGLSRDLNPGPPAPKAGIIPLDH